MDLSRASHAFITGGASASTSTSTSGSGSGPGIAEALAARGLKVTVADIDREALKAVVAAEGANSSEGWRGRHLDARPGIAEDAPYILAHPGVRASMAQRPAGLKAASDLRETETA
ncbi:MAG: hypothetical protein QM676_00700 [Novosphingobium sp.]